MAELEKNIRREVQSHEQFGRARRVFQFYGALRTGRWSSKGIQLQNLPQNHISNLELARQIIASGDFNTVKLQYNDVRTTLSQLIRTTFIPAKGYAFIIADFSAIEARVLACLAGETWRQNVFAENEDIYCISASKMFGVPVVKNGEKGICGRKGKLPRWLLVMAVQWMRSWPWGYLGWHHL